MNGTKINIDTLKLFAAVARNCNFRKSALELAIPVATLSRKISNLENMLDTQLFVRTTRSVKLTETGQQLLEDISDPLKKLNDAADLASHRQDIMSGIVKIATTYAIAETNVLPILPLLRKKWPEIQMHLQLSEDVVDIRSENIDFAIRAGKVKDLSLIARKLCTHHLVYYSTPKMQNISNPRLIAYSKEYSMSLKPNVEVKDMRTILKLVLANQGEAWMPDVLCMEHEKRGELIRVSNNKEIAFDIFLVFGSKKFIPKRVRYVMDIIIEHATQFTRNVKSY